MSHLNYPKTYDKSYRGRHICCNQYAQYDPDILCYVDGIQLGCFWGSTQAAVNAAQTHINRVIEEEEK